MFCYIIEIPVQIDLGAGFKERGEENTRKLLFVWLLVWGVEDKVKLLISKRCTIVKGLSLSVTIVKCKVTGTL